MSRAVDLFAGPGGWDVAARDLGVEVVGIEHDAAACQTRAAAGHATIRADVAMYPPERFAGFDGVIASPPCQDFSLAGKGAGRTGEKGRLIDTVPVWVDVIRPRWVACEQVPPCLPIWREHAARYRELGYSTWAGVLNAADYGVPQTRKRAILLASLDGPALPPAPTHSKHAAPGLFDTRERWVTMAQALGWGSGTKTERGPGRARVLRSGVGRAPTLTGAAVGKGVWTVRREPSHHPGMWALDRPATTIAGDPRISPPCHHDDGTQGKNAVALEDVQRWAESRPSTTIVGSFSPDTVAPPTYRKAGDGPRQSQPGAIKITERDALILQSFDPDYPVQGSRSKRFEQIGNAVPPLLARHVLSALVG